MKTQPDPSFPLLASDQADVMRIFDELMQERSRAAGKPDANTQNKSLEPGNNSDAPQPPHELFDYE